MKTIQNAFIFRIIFYSFVTAFVLSLISLLCLTFISEMVVADYRNQYLTFIGKAIERSSKHGPISYIDMEKYPAPPEPQKDVLSLLEVKKEIPKAPSLLDQEGYWFKQPEPNSEDRSKPFLWLVSKNGTVISSNNSNTLPMDWNDVIKPDQTHKVISTGMSFLFGPQTFMLKLKTSPTTYLVSRNGRSFYPGPLLRVQGLLTFVTVTIAVFLALWITFYYLRKKSAEARSILARMEAGDLKARFKIKKFDQLGILMLDFNRMASEIERLVNRLRKTETTRSHLLQELSHDLRTPLTSLNTSFETLKAHHEKIDEDTRSELFGMIEADINYFKELLEKMTIVATLDEPLYKARAQKVELDSILESEIKSRQLGSGDALKWSYEVLAQGPKIIMGDLNLITRMMKNALDNASRYAKGKVDVVLKVSSNKLNIFVLDDGPGLSEDALKEFGKRREQRKFKDQGASHFSLGLGSVIMKSVAEVHGGEVEITNIHNNGMVAGACLKIELPVSEN